MKTVCLNMIVKNESKTIQKCIASVKKHLNSWVIVDTGSTDGTQQLVRAALKDLPGKLHERPWVHFEHNRNEALQLSRGQGDYLLFIDADEELIGLRGKCFGELTLDYYFVEHRMHGYSFQRTLLIANRPEWLWQGVVHETLCHPQPESLRSAPLTGFYKLCPPRTIAQGIEKVLRDAELLEEAHRKNPLDTRTVFYLAQSYFEGCNYAKAYHYYEKRAAMKGWDQEIYWALFRSALVLEHHLHGKPEEFIPRYLQAYQFRPSRIEALYYLAYYYAKHNQALPAYQLLKTALATPPSDDAVLVERWMYDWGLELLLLPCAKALGYLEEERRLAQQLLQTPRLPAKEREQLRAHFP